MSWFKLHSFQKGQTPNIDLDAWPRLVAGSDRHILDLAQFGADSVDFLVAGFPFFLSLLHSVSYRRQIPEDTFQRIFDLLDMIDQRSDGRTVGVAVELDFGSFGCGGFSGFGHAFFFPFLGWASGGFFIISCGRRG